MDGIQLILAVMFLVVVMLMIRTSQINRRLEQLDDYVNGCVTKDLLRETVVAAIGDALGGR